YRPEALWRCAGQYAAGPIILSFLTGTPADVTVYGSRGTRVQSGIEPKPRPGPGRRMAGGVGPRPARSQPPPSGREIRKSVRGFVATSFQRAYELGAEVVSASISSRWKSTKGPAVSSARKP